MTAARVEQATAAVDRFLVQCLNAKASGLRVRPQGRIASALPRLCLTMVSCAPLASSALLQPLNTLIVTQFNSTSTTILARMAATSGWQANPTVMVRRLTQSFSHAPCPEASLPLVVQG